MQLPKARDAHDFAKYFVWFCCCCILFFMFAVLRPVGEPDYTVTVPSYTATELPLGPPVKSALPSLAHEDLKYILQWTPSTNSPLKEMGRGRSTFLDNNCEYTNCYVTNDRNFFLDMTEFDVIVFHAKETFKLQPKDLPNKRSPSQIYIFAMMESSHYFPACMEKWNGFFNWTWTYRLDSDIRLGYLSFYDKLEPQKRLGPKADMDWSALESQSNGELPQEDLETLKSKSKAAAWFVSNCHSKSNREAVVQDLKKEMAKYNMVLDVYGTCGKLKCPRTMEDQCNKKLEQDYFFYLAFENSFAEDYVTEKLLTALHHLAVPVVFGGANYSRFLPPNSYLDARELGPRETALRMHELLSDPLAYRRMLSWRTRLEYRLTWETEDMCALCARLNQETPRSVNAANLTLWWNSHSSGVCTPTPTAKVGVQTPLPKL